MTLRMLSCYLTIGTALYSCGKSEHDCHVLQRSAECVQPGHWPVMLLSAVDYSRSSTNQPNQDQGADSDRCHAE